MFSFVSEAGSHQDAGADDTGDDAENAAFPDGHADADKTGGYANGEGKCHQLITSHRSVQPPIWQCPHYTSFWAKYDENLRETGRLKGNMELWRMQMESILQIRMGKKLYEGNVTYEEGDLIEAVFPLRPDVTVGDQLPCLMTSHFETITHFEAVVLAKQENRVFLFHSPTALEFREQRRRYPRFDMDRKGWIQYQSPDDTGRFAMSAHLVNLVNLSLGGLAFRSNKPIPADAPLSLFVDLYDRNRPDGIVQANLQVLHEKTDPPHYLYGCKITSMGSRSFHNLRKYLLQRQLEERSQIRP
jgi:hypothetical protein